MQMQAAVLQVDRGVLYARAKVIIDEAVDMSEQLRKPRWEPRRGSRR